MTLLKWSGRELDQQLHMTADWITLNLFHVSYVTNVAILTASNDIESLGRSLLSEIVKAHTLLYYAGESPFKAAGIINGNHRLKIRPRGGNCRSRILRKFNFTIFQSNITAPQTGCSSVVL